MTQLVNIREAEGQLSQLLERARVGEEILLSDGGQIVAQLVPVVRKTVRRPGTARGVFSIASDAWESL